MRSKSIVFCEKTGVESAKEISYGVILQSIALSPKKVLHLEK